MSAASPVVVSFFSLCVRSRHRIDGTFLDASPAAVAIYGVSADVIAKRRLQDLLAPEDAADVSQALAEAARSTDALSFVARLPSHGEVSRRLEIVAHAQTSATGEIELVCIARDAATGARTVDEQVQLSNRVDELGRRFERLVAGVPGVVWELWFEDDPSRGRISFVSERCTLMAGYTPHEWLTTKDFWTKLTHPDDLEAAYASSQRVMAEGSSITQSRWITKDGRIIWTDTHVSILRNDDGIPAGMCGVTLEITPRKQAEQEQARLQEEVIRSQERLLAELSTPLIPLGDGIMIMPLIGSLDRARAERVMDTLLHGISASGAGFAILDITGVVTVDTPVADALLKAARGVQLLGAQVVLTGIRPEVAQTLIALGADLGGIVTRGTLQDGIRYATRGRSLR